MALTATIYNFDIELANVDRNVYETLALRVAQQPSETEEYLLTRVIAYCLEYAEGIGFSRGIAEPDEPPLAVRDLTGALELWVEFGAPDAARLHRASKAAPRVAIYTHRDPLHLLRQYRGRAHPSRGGDRDVRGGSSAPRRFDRAARSPHVLSAVRHREPSLFHARWPRDRWRHRAPLARFGRLTSFSHSPQERYMVDISVDGEKAVFEVEGIDKLWCLRSRLEIPLAHIKGVRADPTVARGWWHGIRLLGTNIPGVLTAGTFHRMETTCSGMCTTRSSTIVLELDHEFYDQLIIEVPDPAKAVALLRVQDWVGARRIDRGLPHQPVPSAPEKAIFQVTHDHTLRPVTTPRRPRRPRRRTSARRARRRSLPAGMPIRPRANGCWRDTARCARTASGDSTPS